MTQLSAVAELAGLPPGPELAAALAGIDPDAVGPDDVLGLLQAWSRQRAHVHARMLRAVVAVSPPGKAAVASSSCTCPRRSCRGWPSTLTATRSGRG